MSNLRKQLIKLGAQHKALRPHLRPVLDMLKQAGWMSPGLQKSYNQVVGLAEAALEDTRQSIKRSRRENDTNAIAQDVDYLKHQEMKFLAFTRAVEEAKALREIRRAVEGSWYVPGYQTTRAARQVVDNFLAGYEFAAAQSRTTSLASITAADLGADEAAHRFLNNQKIPGIKPAGFYPSWNSGELKVHKHKKSLMRHEFQLKLGSSIDFNSRDIGEFLALYPGREGEAALQAAALDRVKNENITKLIQRLLPRETSYWLTKAWEQVGTPTLRLRWDNVKTSNLNVELDPSRKVGIYSGIAASVPIKCTVTLYAERVVKEPLRLLSDEELASWIYESAPDAVHMDGTWEGTDAQRWKYLLKKWRTMDPKSQQRELENMRRNDPVLASLGSKDASANMTLKLTMEDAAFGFAADLADALVADLFTSYGVTSKMEMPSVLVTEDGWRMHTMAKGSVVAVRVSEGGRDLETIKFRDTDSISKISREVMAILKQLFPVMQNL